MKAGRREALVILGQFIRSSLPLGLRACLVGASLVAGCAPVTPAVGSCTGPGLPNTTTEAAAAEGPSPPSPYLDAVRQQIRSHWFYPGKRNEATGTCEYQAARVVIEYGILKDGRLAYVAVRQSSGSEVHDQSAVNAIKNAAPFPPVPESLLVGRPGFPVLTTFSYVVPSHSDK